jgi:hypothetical protein
VGSCTCKWWSELGEPPSDLVVVNKSLGMRRLAVISGVMGGEWNLRGGEWNLRGVSGT